MHDSSEKAIPKLLMQEGKLHARLPGSEEPVPVKIAILRPLTSRRELALFNEDGEELALLPDIDFLAPPCRELASAALEERYFMPLVREVVRVSTTFGTHYWSVETDKGLRTFALKEPGKNVTWLSEDRLIIRDTLGNRFEIKSLRDLSDRSRKKALTVL